MKIKFSEAPEIKERLSHIAKGLKFHHIDLERIVCFRSRGSKARVYARIWELPRVWQHALKIKPHYVIEVLEEHFDKQNFEEQTKILIHELLHIPQTFSGALRSHNCFGKQINTKTVESYYRQLNPGSSLLDRMLR